jgi:hypothetical protein
MASGFFGELLFMPQPFRLKPDEKLQQGPGLFESRQECAVKLAEIANAWARIERMLLSVVGAASTTDVEEGRPQVYFDPITMAAMQALESLSARLDVIAAVLAVCVSTEICDLWKEIAPQIRRAGGMRNQVTHCVWLGSDRYPRDILRIERGDALTRYTVADLEAVRKAIRAIEAQLNPFIHRCLAHRVDLALGIKHL